jgi:hypothetical protein
LERSHSLVDAVENSANNQDTLDFFTTVPNEILINILRRVNFEGLLRLESMSKRFHKFIHDNNELWFFMYVSTLERFDSGTFEFEDHEETKESQEKDYQGEQQGR